MHHFRKLLTREQLFTIPNFMSFFRLVLVPFIIWTYLKAEYAIAASLVLLSAATDVLDGIIARKFDMVSDLGKILDPLCDKLTHAALLFCLLTRYWYIWLVLALLAVKELTVAFLGAVMVKRKGQVHSARWYGKLCTVVIEGIMVILVMFPELPQKAVIAMLCVCGAAMIFSMVMYMTFFIGVIVAKDASEEEKQTYEE